MFIAPFTTMLSFSTLLVFITFALSHLFKLQWQRNAQKPKQPSLPPGPKPWPIVGNLPELIINKKKTSVSHWIHSFMKEMNTEIACIRLGNVHVIPKRVEEADNLVRYVLNQCKNGDEGGLVDLRLVARHYCCNLIKKLIFNRGYLGEGKADGGPGFKEEEYVDAILAIVIHLYSFCISDYWPFLRGLDLEGHEKVVEDATRVLEKYNNPIIEDRIQQWRDGKKH
ncbi:hypothetical protein Godav_029863, partial [Gossypium davidsonii]|nr:hypothetical protein [Gossypium davidsonii]